MCHAPSVSDQVDRIVLEAKDHLGPAHVRRIAKAISQTHMFIPIIDEFDRVIDAQTVMLFTDTIKTLSDHARSATVVLVAVGDTVDSLIGQHESVERSLIQVPMRRMSQKEVSEILGKSEATTGIKFTAAAQDFIISMAQGFPHYAHLLGLHSVRAAVDHRSWMVTEAHVEGALVKAIESSQQSLQRAYHSATTTQRKDTLFAQVLLACALAETDELGYFAAADARRPMTTIMGRPYDIASYARHLLSFTDDNRGAVLQRIGQARRFRFRFRNPLIQPYVVMKGLSKGLITKDDLANLNSFKD